MRKKCNTLAAWTFCLAVVIFIISYILYHYMLPGGVFTLTWQPEPGKPVVTMMVAMWGVMFLFASVMSLLIGHIFFPRQGAS